MGSRSIVALSLVMLGCGASGAASEATGACTYVEAGYGPPGEEQLVVEVVAKGLEVPWGVAFLPGGELLVTERPGRVVVVGADGQVSAPVAQPAIRAGSEGGLLGIALHPAFADNRFFYVYLTGEREGRAENRIERWRLSEDLSTASLDRVVFSGIAAAQYHDGGRIRFGPDGMLYVGTGDGREPERSQDPKDPAGKILRLTPEGEVPADNPIAGSPAYVTGVRNSQGFDWLDDGSFVVTDHGPSGELNGWSGHDEVNVARPGENLGWPRVHGCDPYAGARAPSLVWREAAPPGGAAVYRGSAIPGWRGALVVATLRSEHLHVVRFDPNDARARILNHAVYLAGDSGSGRLRDVVMGPDGKLYVTTSNCDGRGTCGADKDRILRIAGTR
ncbi:MAG: PQQ-dependent sugar dehydrogenase [Myxococcales bacterium]|nr:PQQ-dependent sugar dehydrogenase [Myxococcales bacterium]